MSKKPSAANGIPIGAASMVIVSAIPTIMNAIPNIAANIRPVMLSIRANKFHTAITGHKNHGTFFLIGIITSVQHVCAYNLTFSYSRLIVWPGVNIFTSLEAVFANCSASLRSPTMSPQ